MRSTLLTIAMVVPVLMHAATFETIITSSSVALAQFVPVLLAVALATFIWGLVSFIAQSGDEKAVANGKQRMVWGIIALTLIVAMWGIVTLLISIFGLGGVTDCTRPSITPGDTFTIDTCV